MSGQRLVITHNYVNAANPIQYFYQCTHRSREEERDSPPSSPLTSLKNTFGSHFAAGRTRWRQRRHPEIYMGMMFLEEKKCTPRLLLRLTARLHCLHLVTLRRCSLLQHLEPGISSAASLIRGHCTALYCLLAPFLCILNPKVYSIF